MFTVEEDCGGHPQEVTPTAVPPCRAWSIVRTELQAPPWPVRVPTGESHYSQFLRLYRV